MFLSIIVPTFNEEQALEATLKGLRQLQSVPYELIVADSDSRDATVSIAKRYADRVVSYRGGTRSAARGRNLGASVAVGDVLAFVDADVTIDRINSALRAAMLAFATQQTLVAIAPRVGIHPRVRTWADRVSYAVANAGVWATNKLGRGFGSGELQLVRASTFAKVGGYNEFIPIAEDVDLYGRLGRMGHVKMFWKILVLHPGRRPHAIGWAVLWGQWLLNIGSVIWRGRSWSRAWAPIR